MDEHRPVNSCGDVGLGSFSRRPLNADHSEFGSKEHLKSGQFDLERVETLIKEYEDQDRHITAARLLFKRHASTLSLARKTRDAFKRGVFFSRLPLELVRYIFLLSADLSQVSPLRDFRGLLSSFRLAHIDTRWRAVALDIPQLWSAITVTNKSSIDFLRFLFEHSKACPLYVRLKRNLSSDRLELLQLHASRIETINFRSTDPQVIEEFASALCTPKLTTVEWFPRISDWEKFSLPSFPSARLATVRTNFVAVLPPIPHLTELDIHIDLDTLDHSPLELLASYPQLRVCKIKVSDLCEPDEGELYDGVQPKVHAEHLTDLHLSLGGCNWRVLLSLMSHLEAPKLEVLSLGLNDNLNSSDATSWTSAKHRSFGLVGVKRLILNLGLVELDDESDPEEIELFYLDAFDVLSDFCQVQYLELQQPHLYYIQTFLGRFPEARTLVLHDPKFQYSDNRDHQVDGVLRHFPKLEKVEIATELNNEGIRRNIEKVVEGKNCSLIWSCK